MNNKQTDSLLKSSVLSSGYPVRILGNSLKDILRYNKNHTWEEVGEMKEGRSDHAVAVLEDVSQLCP